MGTGGLEPVTEFLAMGGYAQYLWPSMAMFVGLLLWLAWSSHRRHQRTLSQLRQQQGVAT
jgi:heme exporter protein CcmD